MATDVAVSAATEITKPLIVRIGRQVDYVWSYEDHLRDLENEAAMLRGIRDSIQHRCNAALWNARKIEPMVEAWLSEVKKVIQEVDLLLKRDAISRRGCFYRWIPNLKARYVIGRKVKKTTVPALKQLNGRGTFGNIFYEDSGLTVMSIKDYVAFESRTSILTDIMEALEDAKTNLIGVYGPGGVGKSTLVKQVMRQAAEQKLFDDIAIAIVSQDPDLKRIQGELADRLGLKFEEDSLVGRADRLYRRLTNEKRKVLVILDDLWKSLNIEEVGIPRDGAVKLLLTSRNQNLLSTAMGSQKDFQLEPLKGEEPWRLFEAVVGERVRDPNLRPIADDMVKKCSGFPIPLKTLAMTLKNRSPSEWKDALAQLEGSTYAYSNLELTYKHLEGQELKSLFLICSLLGRGTLGAEFLLKYSMGFGLFEEFDTLEKVKDRAEKLFRSLESSFLIEIEATGDVKIHSTVQEAAIGIASKELNALVMNRDERLNKWPIDKLRRSRAIALHYVDICQLPEGLECPELQIFILYAKDGSLQVPDTFFEGMRELKALDLSFMHFAALPASVQLLQNLTTLCLDHCSVDDVRIIGKLRWLQILSFIESKITELPKEIGELSELRLLDLTRCSKLKKIEPGVLRSLTRLEELWMGASFNLWETKERATSEQQSNASLDELNNMPRLSTLVVHIPSTWMLPEDLQLGKLVKYSILIGDIWDWSDDDDNEEEEDRTLKLKVDSRGDLLAKWVQTTLQKTHDLSLDGLEGMENSINELCIEGFNELKLLSVRSCPSVNYVTYGVEWLPCTAFTLLESLFLQNLINLEKICQGHLSPESFSKLKVVKVERCGKLKNLFSLSLMKGLPELEEIDVSKCENIQEIFMDERADRDDEEDAAPRSSKLEVNSLRKLLLQNLSNITSFCNKRRSSGGRELEDEIRPHAALFRVQQVSIPFLESLILSELPELQEIWHSTGLVLELSHLKSLEVVTCENLLNVINSSAVNLENFPLEQLTVKNCELLQELFNVDMVQVNGDVEILSRLTELHLVDLPSLDRILKSNTPQGRTLIVFRNLKSLKITNCNNLRNLFSLSSAETLVQMTTLEVVRCATMEEIIFVEEDGVEVGMASDLVLPSLKNLILTNMPNLTSFVCGDSFIACPSLKVLIIRECPGMKAFSMAKHDYLTESREGQAFHARTPPACFFNQKVLLPSLEALTLKSAGSVEKLWHNGLPAQSFSQLARVYVERCKNLSIIFPSTLIERLQNLNEVRIIQCTSLVTLFESIELLHTKKMRKKALKFSELKVLYLEELPKLQDVLKNSSHLVMSFPSLKEIHAIDCNSIASLFPNATARTLQKLEFLKIFGCSRTREIFTREEGGDEEIMQKMLFPRLRTMFLQKLSSLFSFSSGSCIFDFPSLQTLEIYECPNLEIFIQRPETDQMKSIQTRDDVSLPLFDKKVGFPKLVSLFLSKVGNMQKIWEGELPLDSFSKLNFLTVMFCKKLRVIFPSDVVRRFHNLKKLTVTNCSSVDGIFQMEELRPEESDIIITYHLMELRMDKLPKLKDVVKCSSHSVVSFPNLEKIHAVDCNNLFTLFPNATARTLLKLEFLEIAGCGRMREIFTMEEGGDKEMMHEILFPRLRYMFLHKLTSLVSFSSGCCVYDFPSLHTLEIAECPNLEKFIQRPETDQMKSIESCEDNIHPLFDKKARFPNMESLYLYGVGNLQKIWEGDLSLDCFRKLNSLTVRFCEKLRIIFPSDVLRKFQNLEKLIVGDCSFVEEIFQMEDLNPEESDSIITFHLKELIMNRLPRLKHVWEKDPRETLSFAELQKVRIITSKELEILFPASVARGLASLEELVVYDCGLEKIVADETGGNDEASDLFFPRLTTLDLSYLPNLRSFCPGSSASSWLSLKILRFSHCEKMRIFNSTSVSKEDGELPNQLDKKAVFSAFQVIPKLEELNLTSEEVLMVENGEFPEGIFHGLKTFCLACFHDDSAVFPSRFILERFHNVEKLIIHHSSFKEIFPHEAFGGRERFPYKARSTDEGKLPLQMLRELQLSILCNIELIWKEDSLLAEILKRIETLKVFSCAGLITLFPQHSASLHNLTELHVVNCVGVKHLMTPSAATSLVQLSRMFIVDCQKIGEIVAGSDNEEEDGVCFKQLKHLGLHGLPSLTSFSSTNCNFTFPCLREVVVNNCPSMKLFSQGALTAPCLSKVHTTVNIKNGKWSWDGDLNTTIQQIFHRSRPEENLVSKDGNEGKEDEIEEVEEEEVGRGHRGGQGKTEEWNHHHEETTMA